MGKQQPTESYTENIYTYLSVVFDEDEIHC